jgi:branched-chain amino acid aminotransferase
MAGAYDDRDGVIWLDGAFVPWREAKVHILTHALHYASSVFEGERAYGGEIFKSREHTDRLLRSCDYLDIPHPYTADEIEAAKNAALAKSGLTDAYVRPLVWRGSGPDMGVASARNPVHLAIAVWEWGAYYVPGGHRPPLCPSARRCRRSRRSLRRSSPTSPPR